MYLKQFKNETNICTLKIFKNFKKVKEENKTDLGSLFYLYTHVLNLSIQVKLKLDCKNLMKEILIIHIFMSQFYNFSL